MKESATNIQIFNWGCDFDKTLRYEVKPNTAAYSCTLSKLISTWNRNSATLKTLLPYFFYLLNVYVICFVNCWMGSSIFYNVPSLWVTGVTYLGIPHFTDSAVFLNIFQSAFAPSPFLCQF